MIIDGKTIAHSIHLELKKHLSQLAPHQPGLAFILIGDNPASHAYVNMKKKGCAEVGIHSESYYLPDDISEKELLHTILKCNQNPQIHGILVQQPLPKHISEKKVIETIDPNKDVDGFHPINVGKALLGQDDGFLPCTPFGIITLLHKANIEVEGKHVVIIGRSNIVGKPLAAMLVQKTSHCNATVTIVHSHTRHLKEICKTADILVAAIGKPKFVTKDMVKPGAVVIDVGINAIEAGGKRKLVGDVDFDHVAPHSSHITPVPGGIGPMTIAMLLYNTYLSFLRKNPTLKGSLFRLP
jgi:methylenetetrahydrofolate dehydrogenase (NADP+)/methenyltetrahydrofolate cyclohydrolase